MHHIKRDKSFYQQLLSESTVADMLNISRSKLRKDRVNNTGLPFIRIGRAVRYSLVDINAWINSRKVGGNS